MGKISERIPADSARVFTEQIGRNLGILSYADMIILRRSSLRIL